jgi:ATP-dependent Lon protease
VQQRSKRVNGTVLCLVGPPGVGKTSLAKSIARATGRKFVRISLGGVRDESEIRGHRRTYIASMPGKILQGLKTAGVSNPLILLDEIDKLGSDWRGDPASALLEVLDKEQNKEFNDHYLELGYDLSQVMFICTANTLKMHPALLDRMEVVHIPGYTEEERMDIALKHLLPKKKQEAGLTEDELDIDPEAIRTLIRYYCREAGVRQLERELTNICRKVTKEIVLEESRSQSYLEEKSPNETAPLEEQESLNDAENHITVHLTPQNAKKTQEDDKHCAPLHLVQSKPSYRFYVHGANLEKYAGIARYHSDECTKEPALGITAGLAWTESGGSILLIEALLLAGKGGKIVSTGKLGDVMKESIQAAFSYAKSRGFAYGIHPSIFDKHDLHIHVPEGATPKDGPSAGIAMVTSIVSVLTNIPVRCDVAMTGEISLRGRVLPIGGLKEKLLGACRSGIKTVLIPKDNIRDLAEVPDSVKASLEIIPVSHADEVLRHALVNPLIPIEEDDLRNHFLTQNDHTLPVREREVGDLPLRSLS